MSGSSFSWDVGIGREVDVARGDAFVETVAGGSDRIVVPHVATNR